jgi:hypothetical protein
MGRDGSGVSALVGLDGFVVRVQARRPSASRTRTALASKYEASNNGFVAGQGRDDDQFQANDEVL